MQFIDAVFRCKVRGYIARESVPWNKYWKNHPARLENRVPAKDQEADDWGIFDPEGEETSIVG